MGNDLITIEYNNLSKESKFWILIINEFLADYKTFIRLGPNIQISKDEHEEFKETTIEELKEVRFKIMLERNLEKSFDILLDYIRKNEKFLLYFGKHINIIKLENRRYNYKSCKGHYYKDATCIENDNRYSVELFTNDPNIKCYENNFVEKLITSKWSFNVEVSRISEGKNYYLEI